MLYFFKISCLILKFRYKKLIFNTNNLEKILPEKVLYKSTLNFIFNKTKQVKKNAIIKNNEALSPESKITIAQSNVKRIKKIF